MYFQNMMAFARHVGHLAVAESIVDMAGRGEVAHFFKKEILAKIGNPAKLGPPLAQSTIDRKGHDGPLLETGVLRDSIGWEHVSKRHTVVGSTDKKALWHELGPTNNRFPRRSFLASTAQEKNNEAFDLYLAHIHKIASTAGTVARTN